MLVRPLDVVQRNATISSVLGLWPGNLDYGVLPSKQAGVGGVGVLDFFRMVIEVLKTA